VEGIPMNKNILQYVVILCLGLLLVVSSSQAGGGGFGLAGSTFSQGGTGAVPLSAASFQMHTSLGQPGPVGDAQSASFRMAGGYGAVLGAPAGGVPSILISEVLYDPPAGCTEPGAEWVELYNAGSSAITLTNWQLCDDSSCDTIPMTTIQPNQGLVVAGAQAAFLACYTCGSGHVVYVADGALGDGLGNDGDRVRLLDNNGVEVDAISYGTDSYAFTPACPDVSEGHSLERYPIQQDTNAAGDFRDRTNPGPCVNPTAVLLARFAAQAQTPIALAVGLAALVLDGAWIVARRRRGQ
jgi:hypothetical protein